MKKLLLLLAVLVSFVGFVQAEEASYKIVFKTGANTGQTFNSSTKLATVITEGAAYLESVQSAKNAFPTTPEGIRVGSSNGAGYVIFNTSASGKVKASKLIITAKGSGNNSRLAIDQEASKAYGTVISTKEYTPYTFDLDGTELAQIKLYGYARVFIQSIEVVYTRGGETPVEPVEPIDYVFDQKIPATMKVGSSYQINFDAGKPSNNFELISLYDNIATVSETGLIKAVSAGTAEFMASWDADDTYKAGSYDFSIEVTEPVAGSFDATLTVNSFFPKEILTAYTNTSYDDADAGMTYKANLAGKNTENPAIQLRSGTSKNSPQHSGIVISANTNGYIASTVALEWNSATSVERKVDVYGLHKAFNDPNDLYDTTTQRTLLGSISKNENLPIELSGEYNYIALRSNDGALYLDAITITWAPAVTPDVPAIEGWTEGTVLRAGDKITFKGKPGQNLHWTMEDYNPAQSVMRRAAAIEGWTAADGHEHTLTVDDTVFGHVYKVKAVNGSLTHESEPVLIGISATGETTGVEAESAEAPEAPVEWFNLQGVRVENPQGGLYIRRQGNKVEKVAVK